MKFLILFISLSSFIYACNQKKETAVSSEVKFDKEKWLTKDGQAYPYRNDMLGNLIDNVTLKGIRYDSLINILGQPDRIDNGHLFYNIYRKEVVGFTLGTKTFVIKLTQDSIVEWRKIHGG